jgi:hypothetical protein
MAPTLAQIHANAYAQGFKDSEKSLLDLTVALPTEQREAPLDSESRVPQEADQALFQPGGNGDPSPNPSAERTIGSTASVSITGGANSPQPDESPLVDAMTCPHCGGPMASRDEGDPNQYEMLSTSARLAPNEGKEPGYAEAPSSGPDDRKQGWKDPSGDDDWLAAIGAGP